MPQPAAVPRFTEADYDRTLVLGIELSSKNWVLAAQVPGLAQVKAKRTQRAHEGSPARSARQLSSARCSCGPSDRAGGLHLRSRLVGVLAGSLAHHARRSGLRRPSRPHMAESGRSAPEGVGIECRLPSGRAFRTLGCSHNALLADKRLSCTEPMTGATRPSTCRQRKMTSPIARGAAQLHSPE